MALSGWAKSAVEKETSVKMMSDLRVFIVSVYVGGVKISSFVKQICMQTPLHYFPKIRRMVVYKKGTIEDARDVFQEGLNTFVNNIYKRKLLWT